MGGGIVRCASTGRAMRVCVEQDAEVTVVAPLPDLPSVKALLYVRAGLEGRDASELLRRLSAMFFKDQLQPSASMVVADPAV
jgi:hypothetical protein